MPGGAPPRMRADRRRGESAHEEGLEILRTARPGIPLPAVGAGMLNEQAADPIMHASHLYPLAAIQGASLTLARINPTRGRRSPRSPLREGTVRPLRGRS